MEVYLHFFLIIIGFGLLIKGADFLVNGASSLAKRLRVSDLAIGLTIVAMGTSAPELVVNFFSGSNAGGDIETSKKALGLVFGNIIGSNIFNIFLILGTASLIYPLTVQKSALYKDVPYCIGGLILLLFFVNDNWFNSEATNLLSIPEAIILIILFTVFIGHTFVEIRKGNVVDEDEEINILPLWKTVLFISLGIAGLVYGGNLAVTYAVKVAEAYHISERIIGLTILAGGTSLPELATSTVAAFNKKSDLAVGNVVGSNIFNTLFVLPITTFTTAAITPLYYDTTSNLDMYITMIGMLLLVLFMFTLRTRQIDRAEGILFLLGFVCYAYLISTRL